MLTPSYPRWLIRGVSLALTVFILLADIIALPELNLAIFYLLPITLGTWYVSARFGIFLTGASALTWLVADLLREVTYTYAFTPYWNAAVRFGVFFSFTLLFAWLRDRLSYAEHLATTDPLTHLTNRFAFNILVDKEIQRSRRYRHPITIAYIDLDNFKLVNDRWGHSVGDEVLRTVAETLQSGLRSLDVVARLGGDEFAVLLPDTSEDRAQAVLDNLRMLLLEAMNERNLPVTASLGAVTYTVPPETVSDMLRQADDLMYTVKNGGKNQLKHQVVEAA